MQVPVSAVTFDAGQTLIELDTAMLARRLGERGLAADAAALEAAVPGAWRTYDALLAAGQVGHGGGGGGRATNGWKALMDALLAGAGIPADAAAPAVDWLWTEQPARNLWRRPVAGMIELVDDLRRAGIAVGVISNSEGRLAELFDEIGWRGRFACVADSGALGIEKPDPAIFAWTLARLGVTAAATVHVGDSAAADVAGARAAGLRAIWFGPHTAPTPDHAVVSASDAAGVRAALSAWAVPLSP
jgi:HAD superfamily hydrolase (TIGR01509 family)